MGSRKIMGFVQYLRENFGPTMSTVRPGFDLNTYFSEEKQRQFNPDSLGYALAIIAGQNVATELQLLLEQEYRENATLKVRNRELADRLEETEQEVSNLRMALSHYQATVGNDGSSQSIRSPPAAFQTPVRQAAAIWSPTSHGASTPSGPASAPPSIYFGTSGSKYCRTGDDVHHFAEAYGFGHAETSGPVFRYDSPSTAISKGKDINQDSVDTLTQTQLENLRVAEGLRTATTPEIAQAIVAAKNEILVSLPYLAPTVKTQKEPIQTPTTTEFKASDQFSSPFETEHPNPPNSAVTSPSPESTTVASNVRTPSAAVPLAPATSPSRNINTIAPTTLTTETATTDTTAPRKPSTPRSWATTLRNAPSPPPCSPLPSHRGPSDLKATANHHHSSPRTRPQGPQPGVLPPTCALRRDRLTKARDAPAAAKGAASGDGRGDRRGEGEKEFKIGYDFSRKRGRGRGRGSSRGG